MLSRLHYPCCVSTILVQLEGSADMSIYSVRDELKGAQLAIVLTGAGVSVESGIPDFRSSGGIWEKYPPELHGTIEAFRENPERFWTFYLELSRLCGDARPNQAHLALAKLESAGLIDHVITQNVDGLHQAAGSKSVIELHGSPDALICLACRSRRRARIAELTSPPRCECGAILKPDVVLFNEMLPLEAIEKAQELARRCDVCLVVGTSAVVYPAATIPEIAFEHGATVCEFNLESTSLTHSGKVRHFIEGSASATLSRLQDLL
jgi:NAD-dependent deacetylase